MKNRIIAFLLLLLPAITAAESRPPNFLLILADDLGFSDLGCYGGEIATPRLDELAMTGARFTQFYNTARCWPTRASLLTGYYAQEVRRDALPGGAGGGAVRKNARPEWAPLLPEFLRQAGYRSYHSGKWHIDGPVLASGFDRSYHVENQGNYFTDRGNFLDDRPIKVPEKESGYYSTIATADHAIGFLKEHAGGHAEKPFFAYVAFIAPHFPLQALPGDIARYEGRYAAGWEKLREERRARQGRMGLVNTPLSPMERNVGPPYGNRIPAELGEGEVNRPVPWDDLSPAQQSFQATKMAIHAAMVDRMDREIGRIVDQLKEMGAYENTVIMFASDNGASAEIMVRDGGHDPSAPMGSAATYLCLGPGFSSLSNTPFRRHKTWVHEGGISTPFIVHWPAGLRNGGLRHTPAHVIDVAPTVLELAGVKKPAEWKGSAIPAAPGKSLVAAFDSAAEVGRDHLWWLHEGNRALRVGDWKLVAAKGEPWELYDLSTDRAERINLAQEMPGKVREMAAKWEAETKRIKDLAKPRN